MVLAPASDMAGVRHFEDLDAWKLSVELRDLVYKMIKSGRVLQDPEFRRQIRKSAASAPSNISEGWGRFKPRENAYYCCTAKASLDETRNHLRHGFNEKYFDKENFTTAMMLARRARGATLGLIRYLESCKGRLPWDEPRKPRKKRKPGNRTRTRNRNRNQNQNLEPGTSKNPEPGTGNPEPT